MSTKTTRYRFEVRGVGEGVWSNNAITYTTPEKAEEGARDLASRWMGMTAWRVVPADHPKRERFDVDDKRFTIHLA